MAMVRTARHHAVILLAAALLTGCAGTPSGTPGASPLDVAAVTDALGKAGIAVVEVASLGSGC
jgi:type IV pilus biogenesis protein CpaD/CtpE